MIAKVIAGGRTRDEALARLRRAVADTHVVIEGGATNKSFLLDLLDQDAVIDASADTGWIDRERAAGRLAEDRHSGIALVTAGIEAYEDDEQVELTRLLETARGGRPQVQHRVARPVDLKLRGRTYKVAVSRIGPHRFRVAVADNGTTHVVTATVRRLSANHARLTVSGRTHRLVTATSGPVHFVEVDGVAHRVSRDEGGVLRSPAPALVVATPAPVGAEVAAGAPVLVLESMKMETRINAPFAATVRELHVSTGSQVETGSPLIRLEPTGDAVETATVAEVDLDLPEPSAEDEHTLTDLTAVLLGYDVDPGDDGATLQRYLVARDATAERGGDVLDGEIGLLGVFADFAELSRNRPADEEARTELRVHSPREYFHSYLQTLDVERSGLPELFSTKLRSVLAHYGITDLERTPELEAAVFRIFLAQQRSAPDLAVVTALLRRWHTEPAPDDDRAAAVRELLDRVVVATQLRFPAVGDLARSVRFRWFDQPVVDRERADVLAGVPDEVEYLAENPDAPDRAARMDALSAIPERIVSFLSERVLDGVPGPEPLLEVLVRRHYREYALRRPALARRRRPAGRASPTTCWTTVRRTWSRPSAASTSWTRTAGSSRAVVRAAGRPQRRAAGRRRPLPRLARRARRHGRAARRRARPARRRPVRPRRAAGGGRRLHRRASGHLSDRSGRAGATSSRTCSCAACTRWSAGGWTCGGCGSSTSPGWTRPRTCCSTTAWRKNNEADQRLVAMAQVRELAVVRDDDGRVSSLPQVERAIASCVEGIRRARAAPGDPRGRAGHEPRLGAHLAADRGRAGPADRAAPQHRADHGRRRHRRGAGPGPGRRVGGDRFVPVAGRFYYQPGSGVQFSVGPPPTERLVPMDDYARKVVRARRRGTVYPYELHGMVAGEGGSFVEHDLDDTGALVPVERAPGGEQGRHRGRRRHHADRVLPRGHHPRAAARRPDPGAGCGVRGGVLADHRRARPRRDDAGAGRVVRAVGRRPDRDGLRHREHGLGGPARSSASSSSPRPAARSTSSWPASTSAPSRTGTPRRRCSCTPRASWS